MYSNSKINEIVFRYDSDVFHIVYGAWVGLRRALPFPLLSLCGVPYGRYLNDDGNIGILVEFVHVFF